MAIGKANEDPKTKQEKIKEFDDSVSNELENRFLNLISIQTVIASDDEEYMIAMLGTDSEVKQYNGYLGLIILFLLIIILMLLFNYHIGP